MRHAERSDRNNTKWGKVLSRPEHLPEFENPPLDEVVLGVQFAPVPGYQQLHARDVWELFRSEFPLTQEHPSLPPAFETFGAPSRQNLNFGIGPAVNHDRFWFLQPDNTQLLQFQKDRLLHNWRKFGDRQNTYPRFDAILSSFTSELETLSSYFNSNFHKRLEINQCEITYVNKIPVDSKFRCGDWFKFLCFDAEPNDIAISYRYELRNRSDAPYGRLVVDIRSGVDQNNKSVVIFSLTVRGAPTDVDIETAINFLKDGRDTIVTNFAKLTTDSAHKIWERSK